MSSFIKRTEITTKTTKAKIEAREEIREIAKTPSQTEQTKSARFQFIRKRNPKKLAIPFPPLNFKKQEKMWPMTAAVAASTKGRFFDVISNIEESTFKRCKIRFAERAEIVGFAKSRIKAMRAQILNPDLRIFVAPILPEPVSRMSDL